MLTRYECRWPQLVLLCLHILLQSDLVYRSGHTFYHWLGTGFKDCVCGPPQYRHDIAYFSTGGFVPGAKRVCFSIVSSAFPVLYADRRIAFIELSVV